jgi:REP element-mobilizing transposase RayT
MHEYDYTQPGAYFITVCAHERTCVFGDIVDGEMRVNDAGWMVQQCWDEIPEHYPGIEIDAFTVMPNHIHGIVILVGATPPWLPWFNAADTRPMEWAGTGTCHYVG